MKTQEQRILDLLKKGKRLTPLDALNLVGSLRLGARIYALRKQGHKITSSLVKTRSGKYVSEYALEQ